MEQLSLLWDGGDEEIFRRVFQQIKPRTAPPEFAVEYRPYANANSTIRLEEGHQRIRVRMADLLEEAPRAVKEALAHILLGKLYRRPVAEQHNRRYRSYLNRAEVRDKTLHMRRQRGRKHMLSPEGRHYHLEEVFDDLNQRFFGGELARPAIGWSRRASRYLLGHYDPAHHTIVISRVFDRPSVPRLLVDYIVFHEMLHLKHPVEYRSDRRCVHTREFKESEKKFPRLREAIKLLKKL